MAVESTEPLEAVLSFYDIKATGIRNESYKEKKGVWWIQTPSGYLILKKISNSEQTLKHILHAVEHLTQGGVLIPKIVKTKNGQSYVNINGTCYTLSRAINGKNPNYSSPRELEKVVKALAGFHKASAGFRPLPDSKPKYHLGTWLEDYTSQIEEMNSFYLKETAASANNSIGKLVVKEFPYFHDRAWAAIEGLKTGGYEAWVEKAGESGCLCHQDFAAGNLIMDSRGCLYILDTDSITVDIPARDIRKLLNKIMKKSGKWDIELTRRILDLYQQENPLSASEWKVVMLDLLFPHLFLGAMSKYYYKRDREWSEEKYLQRLKEMAEFEKTAEPMLHSYEALIPK